MRFRRKQSELHAGTFVGVTVEGKMAAQQLLATGGSLAILMYLSEHSPKSIYDIGEYTGIDLGELKQRLKTMAQLGYVRVNVGGDDDRSVLGASAGRVPVHGHEIPSG